MHKLGCAKPQKVNGFRIARDGVLVEYSYFDRKKDDTIAFINGWGTVSFSLWARQLRIADYNILLHNSRGMGRSGLGEGDYLNMAAGDIEELLKETAARRVHLVGHSMGGLIGTLFMARYKNGADVRTMTYVCSPDNDPVSTFPFRKFLFFDPEDAIRSYSNGLLGGVAAIAQKSAVLESIAYAASLGGGVGLGRNEFSKLYDNFLSRREAVAKGLASMRANGSEIGQMMGEVNVPALIIAGKKDFLVEYTAARRMKERIPDSKLIIFERSSHAPMTEEPTRFNHVLTDFLEYR